MTNTPTHPLLTLSKNERDDVISALSSMVFISDLRTEATRAELCEFFGREDVEFVYVVDGDCTSEELLAIAKAYTHAFTEDNILDKVDNFEEFRDYMGQGDSAISLKGVRTLTVNDDLWDDEYPSISVYARAWGLNSIDDIIINEPNA